MPRGSIPHRAERYGTRALSRCAEALSQVSSERPDTLTHFVSDLLMHAHFPDVTLPQLLSLVSQPTAKPSWAAEWKTKTRHTHTHKKNFKEVPEHPKVITNQAQQHTVTICISFKVEENKAHEQNHSINHSQTFFWSLSPVCDVPQRCGSVGLCRNQHHIRKNTFI